MHILLTNDDGYLADGMRCLTEELSQWAEVTVVAPDRERSGCGRGITLHHPLRLDTLEPAPGPGVWHVVNGTPTDCVNLALHFVLADDPPDLVVAGINHGLNLGDDVFYSGTVNAACEAHHFDLPAVALSQELGGIGMRESATIASSLLRELFEKGECADLLNINIPADDIRGVRVTRLGHRVYRDVVVAKKDPRGKAYYWLAGRPEWEVPTGHDQQAILEGYVAVTPLAMGVTDESRLEPLSERVATLFEGLFV